ncbi:MULTISPECIES: DUF982 domain-containing protein [Mesorhizobium]|uniref:Uncharacterized protein n=1 Tax=Rhizobium loti TaxID=381 RepID=A0A6M7TYS6_RHILI|nr:MULTISPECIES: DUF982 domain-containing protein [Mesorhizobium]KRB23740.1 hypothetical protein ASE05_11000 [Mesorhizobium sp. Root172]OBQ63250.1 hypothetical protein A8145_19110 [Mesorhizobium loti]QKC70281.1 DUF982 domain-containing protein [Mesorhizobium loti]QKC89258.1 DUF982 domain-containing protein [Mesorhizobium sp. NZP2234]
MEHDRFQHPVRVLVGLGFPTDIQSVKDAFVLLDEWPPSKRGPAHGVALNACRAALAGEVDAETARGTFVAFARRMDLLVQAEGDIVAAKAVGAFGAASKGPYNKSM